MKVYRCPVCHKVLNMNNNTYQCENHHSFDISSRGYTNFLLANQKHSVNPGDSKEMILSRVKFLELDYYAFLRQEILKIIDKYSIEKDFIFCDLACGEGYYTNYLHQSLQKKYNIVTYGVDISKYAIIEACKKQKSNNLSNINYCIGNLMNLPYMDESFYFMLNCFALLDENEFYRVLKDKGFFIRVLPDFDHLYQLKEKIYDKVILNSMKEKELKGFKLVDEIHIKNDITLKTNEEIMSLFKMTPYYYKTSLDSINKLSQLNSLTTIASFVLLVYQKEKF